MSCAYISSLPEECIAHILSLTTSRDVVRSSAVSKQLLSASESDIIWDKFLPSDIELIISQSSAPLAHQPLTSKKQLFCHLCRFPILLDNNNLSFALDIWSGKKCYMIRAMTLMIERGITPNHWIRRSDLMSRFQEKVELYWIDIKGKIHTKLLSPNTSYGVYLVFKIGVKYPAGHEHTTVTMSVLEVDEGLPRNEDELRRNMVVLKNIYLRAPVESEESTQLRKHGELPIKRRDGWMEIEMERYRVGVESVASESMVLEVCMRDVNGLNWKPGLLFQGIELRPLD